MVDIGSAGIEGDIGELPQRKVGVAARPPGNLDIGYGLKGVAVLFGKPNPDAELAVTFQLGRGNRAPQRRLDRRVDVAGIEAIARRLFTIHRDVEIRLPEDVKDPEIGHAPDLLHFMFDLLGDPLLNCQIWTDDLDRICALDAGQRLLDVVLNVLREIKGRAGHRVGEFLLKLLGQFVLGQPCGPFVKRLERNEQFDVGER